MGPQRRIVANQQGYDMLSRGIRSDCVCRTCRDEVSCDLPTAERRRLRKEEGCNAIE